MPSLRYFWLPSSLFFISVILSVLGWADVFGPYPASKELIFDKGYFLNALAATFYHADTAHLLSNAILLLFFGWALNAYFGWFVAIIVPVFAATLTNLVTVSQYPAYVELIGASGMVYAMVAMWVVFYLRFEKYRPLSHRIVRVVGFVLLLLFPTHYDPKTSYLAHASGFIIGTTLAFIALPFVSLNNPNATHYEDRLVNREPAIFVNLGQTFKHSNYFFPSNNFFKSRTGEK